MKADRKEVQALAGVRGPLAGTLVLEVCGEEPSGSFGTQILADLGATVIKVERLPEKDTAPLAEPAAGQPMRGSLAFFGGLNRNKRIMCLDLKNKKGLETFHALARIAYVVYDNNRPVVTARLGIDYKSLS